MARGGVGVGEERGRGEGWWWGWLERGQGRGVVVILGRARAQSATPQTYRQEDALVKEICERHGTEMQTTEYRERGCMGRARCAHIAEVESRDSSHIYIIIKKRLYSYVKMSIEYRIGYRSTLCALCRLWGFGTLDV